MDAVPSRPVRAAWRRASWALLAAAFVLPAVGAWLQLDALDRAHPDVACGLPVMATFGLALVATGALSLVAAGCSAWALRGGAPPRSWRRRAETAAIAAPAVVVACLLAAFLLA